MGVILIIIYIYNNFIWVGVGYSFSMLQVLLVTKVHFAAFCGRLSRAKAVPLHRISKRAETTQTTQTTKNYANNEYEYKKILNS